MDAPQELAEAGARAYRERGLDGLAETWDPDVVYEEDPLWPGAGIFRGREAVLKRFREYEEQLGAGTVVVEDVAPSADGAVITWRHTGVTEAAGVPFEHRWAWGVRVRDGKATHIRAYFDPDRAVIPPG